MREIFISIFCVASLGLACSDDDGPGTTTSSSSNGAGGGGHASTSTGTGAEGAGASGAGGTGGSPPSTCLVCAPPNEVGTPVNSNIDETSGMAASAIHLDTFYVHNDSGDTARFFATNVNGDDLGTYNVTNASAVDWEDMARGVCADKKQSCLYFGDIGDNLENRNDYVIYRVAEPATLAVGSSASVNAEAFPFAYPDGSQNAEALLVHPVTGAVYIVTKAMSQTKLYELPQPLDGSSKATAILRGNVVVPGLVPLVTAADFDLTGGVFLRTYTNVFYYPQKANSVPQTLAQTPCDIPAPSETQGESIAWVPGNSFRTLGEGKGEPIFSSVCDPR